MSTYQYAKTKRTYSFNYRNTKWLLYADSPYAVLAGDDLINVNPASGIVAITLPAIPKDPKGYFFQCHTSASNSVVISPTGADTIDKTTSFTMTAIADWVWLCGNPLTKNWEVVDTSVAPS